MKRLTPLAVAFALVVPINMLAQVAVAVACTLVFPARLSAQGSLRDSIAREATRAALVAGAVGQESAVPEDWNAVVGLKAKARVKVIRRDGSTLVGNVAGADAASIVIARRWGRDETLSRDEVREIRMRPRRSTGGSAAIGWLAGFGLGATVGLIADSRGPRSDDPQGSILGGAFGGAVGFWTGLGIGAVRNLRPGELIYRAPHGSITQ